ncbi:MAG: hypothetical protein AAGA99_12450 [Actinomycetota bacterium]
MWRNAVVAATALCLVVTVAAGVRTSRADFRDTTDNLGSLFATGTISVGTDGARLDIDVRGLEPTTTVEDCVEVVYEGDLDPVRVRLFSDGLRSGGLEDYLLVRIEEGSSTGGRCDGFVPSQVVFDGTASQLLARHRSAASAFSSWDAASVGASLSYRVRIGVMDDDRAQGLETAFELVAEAAL